MPDTPRILTEQELYDNADVDDELHQSHEALRAQRGEARAERDALQSEVARLTGERAALETRLGVAACELACERGGGEQAKADNERLAARVRELEAQVETIYQMAEMASHVPNSRTLRAIVKLIDDSASGRETT